jgi:hypothetical protein
MALVAAISLVTGRVIRRATASPVSRASNAARPAAPAMARSSAVFRPRSAAPIPEPVIRTTAVPTRCPRTVIGGLSCGPLTVRKLPDWSTTCPPWSRIWTAKPVRAAWSRTSDNPALVQVSFLS